MTPQTDLVDLKPCAHCGGEARYFKTFTDERDWGWVQCQQCGVETTHDTEARCVAAWNTRTPISDEAVERGWQPIETAPKDGTRLLLTCPGKEPVIGFFGTEEDWTFGHWRNEDEGAPDFTWGVEPTHWIPLPEPPAAITALYEGEGV